MGNIEFHDGYWYCYSNSTAMLLSSVNEEISPNLIEALTGVGIGAFYNNNSGLTFLSGAAAEPDIGISKALEILGFDFREEGNFNSAPFPELEQILKNSPVVLGPLDMFYLNYNPDRPKSKGVDHYILVYAIEGDKVYLNDPAGYEKVYIKKSDLENAWRADEVSYKRGSYRFWSNPRRVRFPTSLEMFQDAMRWYKQLYKESDLKEKQGTIINENALLKLASDLKNDRIIEYQREFLNSFAIPLAVKRATDLSGFVKEYSLELSKIKEKQSTLYGECQSNLMFGNTDLAVANLIALAKLEIEQKIVINKLC